MSLRREFVLLALNEDTNRRELCRRFGISPKTGYKWLARYADDEVASLGDRIGRRRVFRAGFVVSALGLAGACGWPERGIG